MIAVLSLSPKQSAEHTEGNTHTSGISAVLYNELFKARSYKIQKKKVYKKEFV